MAYTIIRADEPLPDKKLVVVLYGPPGSWKTSVSFTAPKPILLNFDDGLHRSVKRGDAISFEKWEDCVEFCESKDFQEYNPETLIFDTGGAMLDDFMAASVMAESKHNRKGNGGLSQQGYGALKIKFDQFFAQFRGKKNIIFLCHEQEDKKSGDSYIVRPKMTGGSYQIMIAKADLIGYMDVSQDERKEPVVHIDFNPSEERYAKNFAEFPPVKIPQYTTDDYSHFMTTLFDSAQEKMRSLSESQKEALELVESIREKIGTCETMDQLKEVNDSLKGMSRTYQIQLGQSINDQMIEIVKNDMSLIDSLEALDTYTNNIFIKLPKDVGAACKETFVELIQDLWQNEIIGDNSLNAAEWDEQLKKVGDFNKTWNKSIRMRLYSLATDQGFFIPDGKEKFESIQKEDAELPEEKEDQKPVQETDQEPVQSAQEEKANIDEPAWLKDVEKKTDSQRNIEAFEAEKK